MSFRSTTYDLHLIPSYGQSPCVIPGWSHQSQACRALWTYLTEARFVGWQVVRRDCLGRKSVVRVGEVRVLGQ